MHFFGRLLCVTFWWILHIICSLYSTFEFSCILPLASEMFSIYDHPLTRVSVTWWDVDPTLRCHAGCKLLVSPYPCCFSHLHVASTFLTAFSTPTSMPLWLAGILTAQGQPTNAHCTVLPPPLHFPYLNPFKVAPYIIRCLISAGRKQSLVQPLDSLLCSVFPSPFVW